MKCEQIQKMNESNEKLIKHLDDEFKNQYEGDNKLMKKLRDAIDNNEIRSECTYIIIILLMCKVLVKD